MLGQTSLLARNLVRFNPVRTLAHGGNPQRAIPIDLSNRYKLTAIFTVFIASGLGAPFFVLRHQLLKK